jgi:hypothetical protein
MRRMSSSHVPHECRTAAIRRLPWARGRVLSIDTIPKPDGLAWPRCGPSSNGNRTQLARCPVLFEHVRLPPGIRGQVKSARRCCRSGCKVTRHPHGSSCRAPRVYACEHESAESVGRSAFTPVYVRKHGPGYPAALLRKWSMVMRMASCFRRDRLSIRSRRSSTLRLGLRCWTISGGVSVWSKA